MSPQLLLTVGMIENWSLRTSASLVDREHRHQESVATQALEGTAAAGCVAEYLAAVTTLDEGFIAFSIRHCVPCQRAVIF